jgi:hypothetical protein
VCVSVCVCGTSALPKTHVASTGVCVRVCVQTRRCVCVCARASAQVGDEGVMWLGSGRRLLCAGCVCICVHVRVFVCKSGRQGRCKTLLRRRAQPRAPCSLCVTSTRHK